MIKNILLVIVVATLFLGGLVWADNGVWHNAEDVVGGTFGTDEGGNQNYIFEGNVTFNSNIDISGNINADNNITIGGDAIVTGDIDAGSDITVDGDINAGGDITVDGVIKSGSDGNVVIQLG